MFGINTVAAFAVRRHPPRRRRIGDQHPARRGRRRQPPLTGAPTPREGHIATGIQNNDIQPIARFLHRPHNLAHGQRLIAHVLLALDPGVEGQEVVLSVHLDPMPGKIKEAHTTLA